MKAVVGSNYKVQMRSLLFVMMAALFIFLSACEIKKAYNGPELAYDKIAIIQPNTEKAFTEIKIVSIDNYKLGLFESKVAVWPGVHKMLIQVKLDFPYLAYAMGFSQKISFKAEASRIYSIQAKIDTVNDEGFLWVTSDNDSDHYVGGTKVGPVKLLSTNQ